MNVVRRMWLTLPSRCWCTAMVRGPASRPQRDIGPRTVAVRVAGEACWTRALRPPVHVMRPDRGAILRPVAVFALSGLAVLALVALAGTLALRSLSTSEAVRDARRLATLTGRGIVEPALTTAVVRGDPQAIARLDRIVRRRVLAPDVARVKVWNAEGTILYSDDASLIGRRYALAPEDLRALRTVDGVGPEDRPVGAGERPRAHPRRPDVGVPGAPRPGRDSGALRGVPAIERDRGPERKARAAVRPGRDHRAPGARGAPDSAGVADGVADPTGRSRTANGCSSAPSTRPIGSAG